MTSLTYVVAPVVNEIELILMAFLSQGNATAHLTRLGLVVETNQYGTFADKATIDGKTMPLSMALDTESHDAEALRKALFAEGNYDSGNGECHRLDLVEKPIGEPVVPFDLD